jgi:hypothetical protein
LPPQRRQRRAENNDDRAPGTTKIPLETTRMDAGGCESARRRPGHDRGEHAPLRATPVQADPGDESEQQSNRDGQTTQSPLTPTRVALLVVTSPPLVSD